MRQQQSFSTTSRSSRRTAPPELPKLELPLPLTVSMGTMCAFWSVVALLSFLEVAHTRVNVGVAGWVALTAAASGTALAGWGVMLSHTHLSQRDGFESFCGAPLAKLFRGFDSWNPLVSQWLVYTVCTSLCTFQFVALYLRYTNDELALLESDRWNYPLPYGLDPVLVSQWQTLHSLVLCTWMVITSTLLIVRIHACLLSVNGDQ